jgi:hypothetical protein
MQILLKNNSSRRAIVASLAISFIFLFSLSLPRVSAASSTGQGAVYVSTSFGSTYVIKGSTVATHTISTGSAVQSAYDPKTREVFFPNDGSGVVVVNASTNKVIKTVTGFGAAVAALYVPSNKMVYVFDALNGSLFKINPAHNFKVTLAMNLGAIGYRYYTNPIYYSAPFMAFSDATKDIYLVNIPVCSNGCPLQGSVFAVSPATNSLVANISLPTGGCYCFPESIGYDPANQNIYVGDTETGYIYIISSSNTWSNTLAGDADDVIGFAYDSANQLLYVTDNGDASYSYYGELVTISSTNFVGFVTSIYFNLPTQISYDTVNHLIYVENHGDDEIMIINGASVDGSPIGLHVQLSDMTAT